MTPKENLLTVFQHKNPQWVPCTPHIANEYNIPGQLPEELLKKPLDRLEISRYVGGDVLYEISPVKFITPSEVKSSSERKSNVVIKTIEAPLGNLSSQEQVTIVKPPVCREMDKELVSAGPIELSRIREFPVKSVQDYKIVRYLYENTKYEFQIEEIEQSINRVGEDGVVVLSGPGTPLYGLISQYAGVEKTIYDLSDHLEEVQETMEVMAESNYQWYQQAVSTKVQVIRCSDDSDTGLISPEMFRKYSVPVLKRYAEICHNQGKLLMLHMCGHIRDFLSLLKETNVDAIHGLCPPSTGNTPLKLARSIFGREIVIIARIDPPILLEGSPEKVSATVIEMLKEVAPADNFILIIPCGRAPLQNLRSAITTMKKYGKYPVKI